ncbi:MAG: hypothetical protein R3D86_06280 [Emcibacteraceae bacterium]
MSIRLFFIVLIGLLMGTMTASANSTEEKKEKAEEISEFVEIPPISVAMYNRRKRPAGTMTVLLQLKIDDSEQREEAIKILPRLKNAYMQETLKLALNFFDIDRPVNANLLSRSLQNATNIVLKHDKARVLISDVAVMKR